MMGMGLLASVCWLAYDRRAHVRIAAGLIAGLLMYGVFVSYTRSAWIAVLVGCVLVPWYIKGLWKMVVPVLLIAVLVLVGKWSRLETSDLVKNRVLAPQNIVGRVDTIEWGWQRFFENPILGKGPGALDLLTERAFDESWSSHNTFLTMLVDGGALLLVSFALIVLRWLRTAGAVIRSTSRNQFEHGLAAVMVGWIIIWLVSGMSLELRYFSYFIACFWITGAIIESLGDICAGQQPEAGPGEALEARA